MLKAATVLLTVVALFSLVVGIVYVVEGTLLPYHQEFIGMTMDEIAELNPDLATLAAIFIRVAGILFIGVGVLSIAVIHLALRKAEAWAWWTILLGMGAINGPLVAITWPVGGFPRMSAVIMLTMFVIAIVLAGRGVLGQAQPGPTASCKSS